MQYPIPLPANAYDPNYKPRFMIIASVEESVNEFPIFLHIENVKLYLLSCMAASIGLFVILLFTLFVANVLVQPLERMFDFSENIFGTKNRNIGDIEKDSVRNNPISRIFQLEKHQRNKWCKTELNTLKKEFQRMLLDFSDRKASKVATTEISEVQNDTSWKEEYSTIYSVDNLSFEKNGETEIFLDDQRQTELQFQMLRSDKYPLMKRLTTIGKSWRKKFPIKSNRRSANDVHNHSSINGNIDQIYDDGVDDGDDGGDEDDDNVDNHHKIKSRRKKLNRGKCTNRDNFSLEVTKTMQAVSLPGQFRILYSPLFLFIAALIALPNLFVLVFISIMFQENINRLHQLFNQIFLDPMNDQRKKIIHTTTTARANYAHEAIQQTVANIIIYNRVVGWLLFGALQRSNSIIEMMSIDELCTNYSNNDISSCPYYQSISCGNCMRKDETTAPFGKQLCENSANDTTYLQNSYYHSEGQVLNVSKLFEESPVYDGVKFDTVENRVKILSALPIIEIPLYNYKRGPNTNKYLGSYVAFETDEMTIGYDGGCGSLSSFLSSNKNIPTTATHPKFFLLEEHRDDSRCQYWYNKSNSSDETLLILPSFENANIFLNRLSLPLIDKALKTYVAQTVLTFYPQSMLKMLTETTPNDGISIMIATENNNVIQKDTSIINPELASDNFESDFQMLTKGDIMLFYDRKNATSFNKLYKDSWGIISQMKSGGSRNSTFNISEYKPSTLLSLFSVIKDDEQIIEYFISYASVNATILKPMSHANFTRGTKSEEIQVYSIAVVVPESESELSEWVMLYFLDAVLPNVRLLFFVTLLTIIFTLFWTHKISTSILKPVIKLTRIIQKINHRDLDEDIRHHKHSNGSMEISRLHISVEKIYKIVRFSNSAILVGRIEESARLIQETRELLRKLGNQAALGIASNNIGTMYLRELMLGNVNRFNELMKLAKLHFDEAIMIGELEMDESTNTHIIMVIIWINYRIDTLIVGCFAFM